MPHQTRVMRKIAGQQRLHAVLVAGAQRHQHIGSQAVHPETVKTVTVDIIKLISNLLGMIGRELQMLGMTGTTDTVSRTDHTVRGGKMTGVTRETGLRAVITGAGKISIAMDMNLQGQTGHKTIMEGMPMITTVRGTGAVIWPSSSRLAQQTPQEATGWLLCSVTHPQLLGTLASMR